MVALPHTDKEPCQCLRCKPRIVVNYMTTFNDKTVAVVAEIGTDGCDFLAQLLQTALDASRETNAPTGAISCIEHLQAIFRRQMPTIVPTAMHGGQANG